MTSSAIARASLPLLGLLPAAVSVLCLVLPRRQASVVTIASGMICFLGVVAVVVGVGDAAGHTVSSGFLRADALSSVFLLAIGLVYAVVSLYLVGYLSTHDGGDSSYERLLHVGVNAFAWSMFCAPMSDGLAQLWIAIEVTTVISALLVALDRTDTATEAAWKYVLIASCGLGIALLATIVMYYAGAEVLGRSYDLAFDPLVKHADELPETPVRLAFVLAVLGFGTKVGLAPVHTWLPDAHAEAPTPVSAMLSGALLTTSFYAILRYDQVARITLGDAFPRTVLLAFGFLTLLVATLSLLLQRDVKRLLAYSSVEHMGILAIGAAFGTRLALLGVMLHVLAHAAAKAAAFMGAGVLVTAFGTKDLDRIRGGIDRLRWSGPMFVASVLALCALPPSGLFRSELLIVAGGVTGGATGYVLLLLALVCIAFLGLLGAASQPMLGRRGGRGVRARRHDPETSPRTSPSPPAADTDRAHAATAVAHRPPRDRVDVTEPSRWMVAPVAVCLAVVVLLGVRPPAALDRVLDLAAMSLLSSTPSDSGAAGEVSAP